MIAIQGKTSKFFQFIRRLNKKKKFEKFNVLPFRAKNQLDIFNFDYLSPAAHDLQKVDANQFITFKNFNRDSILNTNAFKIFEFSKKKIIFEFPLKTEDFVQADFSGGAQKISDMYLAGFPVSSDMNSNSFIALISNKGFYIKRGILPFHIQDIKKYPMMTL